VICTEWAYIIDLYSRTLMESQSRSLLELCCLSGSPQSFIRRLTTGRRALITQPLRLAERRAEEGRIPGSIELPGGCEVGEQVTLQIVP
jgi:hypothetical protein